MGYLERSQDLQFDDVHHEAKDYRLTKQEALSHGKCNSKHIPSILGTERKEK